MRIQNIFLFSSFKEMLYKHQSRFDGYMITKKKFTMIFLPDVELDPSLYDNRIECCYYFKKKDTAPVTEKYNIVYIER